MEHDYPNAENIHKIQEAIWMMDNDTKLEKTLTLLAPQRNAFLKSNYVTLEVFWNIHNNLGRGSIECESSKKIPSLELIKYKTFRNIKLPLKKTILVAFFNYPEIFNFTTELNLIFDKTEFHPEILEALIRTSFPNQRRYGLAFFDGSKEIYLQ